MMRFLLFFLLTCAAAFAGEQIFLEPGTPLFRGPEIVGPPGSYRIPACWWKRRGNGFIIFIKTLWLTGLSWRSSG